MNQNSALIIDDDVEITRLFKTVLGLVGYECEAALTARDALSKLAVNVPSLVLLDMHLGNELGGDDILYQIRSNPRFESTRVIIITAHPQAVNIVSELSDLILVKPVDIDQLSTLVMRMRSWKTGVKDFSFRDPITYLFNLEFYETRLELAFQRFQRRADFHYSAVVLELHPLEKPFEYLTTDITHAVLREAAERLRQVVRPTDTIARLSGWKFILLNEELKTENDVDRIIERVVCELSKPYLIGNETVHARVNHGVGVNKLSDTHSDMILKRAQQALLAAESGEEMVENYPLG